MYPRRNGAALTDGGVFPSELANQTTNLSKDGASCEVLVGNIPAVVELLLERDGLARSDVFKGDSATFLIEAYHSRPLGKEPRPTMLKDYVPNAGDGG